MRKLLLSFFGLGYGPVAPGTWGSGGALAVVLLLWYVGGLSWWGLPILVVAACAVNLAFGGWAQEYYKSSDPKPVVIDEVAGMWLSLVLVPVPTPTENRVRALVVFAAAFLLFRVLDIVKLPPARQLERLPAGAGILCDDLAAGLQTNVILQLVFRVFWGA